MTTFYILVKYNLPEKEKLLEYIIIKPGHPGAVCYSAAGLKWDFQQNSYICFPNVSWGLPILLFLIQLRTHRMKVSSGAEAETSSEDSYIMD